MPEFWCSARCVQLVNVIRNGGKIVNIPTDQSCLQCFAHIGVWSFRHTAKQACECSRAASQWQLSMQQRSLATPRLQHESILPVAPARIAPMTPARIVHLTSARMRSPQAAEHQLCLRRHQGSMQQYGAGKLPGRCAPLLPRGGLTGSPCCSCRTEAARAMVRPHPTCEATQVRDRLS